MPCWSSGDPSNPIHSESKSSWLSFLQRPDQILRPDQPDQWFWLIIKNINAESVVFTLLCLFRLFFRSIPSLGLWQKNYDVVCRLGWSARDISSSWQASTLTPASYNFPSRYQTSEFSIFGNCQSCILLISFCAHSAGISFTCAPPLLWISN